jgi:N-carbamoylputrescine amidase
MQVRRHLGSFGVATDGVTSNIRVAIAQITTAPFAPDANRKRTTDIARDAFQQGAGLVVLPELAIPGYVLEKSGLEASTETIDGPSVQAWIAAAKDHGGYIAGGFAETDDGKLYNAAVLVGPEGVVLHYRKLHLFDAEKEIFTPGNLGLPVGEAAFGKVAICVCYDLRFVEVARAAALRGADILIVPTAWVQGFDREKWDDAGYCPQARGAALQANLNQIFIACASQAGTNGRVDFLGSSLVADPYGKPALGPMPGDSEQIASVEIDLGIARAATERGGRISPRTDRRTDVYGINIDGITL